MSKDKDEHEHHSGSIAAEDEELSLWLNKLWARNEPPERLELWQMFGRNKAVRGELIHHEDFKIGEKLDIEQANKLANEVLAAAQNDCDSTRKEAWFQLAIIDRNRKSSPLTRRIGPLQPKRTYAIAKVNDLNEDDDEESLDAKSLNLRHVQMGLEQSRWDKNRNDRIIDGMLLLQNSIIQELRSDRAALMSSQMTFFQQLQDSLDRSLDRELIREKEKFKQSLLKEGVRTARNLLPGLFGGAEQNTALESDGTGSTPKTYGPSPERTLVDNFLTDCEDSKIEIALFGDCEIRDGKLVQIKPGIFSIKQFYILAGVRNGRLPPTALDNLMPQSGHEDAITQEQIKKAGDAGVTEGIGMALLELVGLRSRAKESTSNEVANEKTN